MMKKYIVLTLLCSLLGTNIPLQSMEGGGGQAGSGEQAGGGGGAGGGGQEGGGGGQALVPAVKKRRGRMEQAKIIVLNQLVSLLRYARREAPVLWSWLPQSVNQFIGPDGQIIRQTPEDVLHGVVATFLTKEEKDNFRLAFPKIALEEHAQAMHGLRGVLDARTMGRIRTERNYIHALTITGCTDFALLGEVVEICPWLKKLNLTS